MRTLVYLVLTRKDLFLEVYLIMQESKINFAVKFSDISVQAKFFENFHYSSSKEK